MALNVDVARQEDYPVRAEWGPRGLRELASRVNVVVIVDVLSFTTCVDIATARGAEILPYRFRDASAAAFAREHDALLAGDNALGLSLRPASLVDIDPGCRLVLPSPNGSTLSTLAAEASERANSDASHRHSGRASTTLAGCLRNARAVAERASAIGPPVAVVASGERWRPDDTLRPAVEDALGAGAIIAHLLDLLADPTAASPEAAAFAAVFETAAHRLPDAVAECVSGREKRARDQVRDVELAAALDVSDCAPQLVERVYRASSGAP